MAARSAPTPPPPCIWVCLWDDPGRPTAEHRGRGGRTRGRQEKEEGVDGIQRGQGGEVDWDKDAGAKGEERKGRGKRQGERKERSEGVRNSTLAGR